MARRWIALTIVVFLPVALMIAYRMRETTPFATVELIAYPLLFGGLGIAAILGLKRWFLGRPWSDFNAGEGTLAADLLHAAGLTAVYFVLFALFRATLADLLAARPNLELLELMLSMRERPLLMLVWFGPVLWIGIALYEELTRVFLLDELWRCSERPAWTVFAIVLAAALVGLVHWSQGPFGIVTIGLKSLVSGAY